MAGVLVNVIPAGEEQFYKSTMYVKYTNYKYATEKWREIVDISVCKNKQWIHAYTYTWNMNTDWDTTCSEECGGGIIRRKAGSCSRTWNLNNTVTNVSEDICKFLYRKDTTNYPYTQPCNTQACPTNYYTWVTFNWGACTAGYHQRNVLCFASYTYNGNKVYHSVADNLCTAQKPATSEACSS